MVLLRRSFLFCFVALAGFLAGCQKSSSELKIGFVLDNMNEERYAKDKEYFEQTAKALGAEVIFASANSDVTLQMNKVENLLSLGVKALVVQPVDSKAAAALVKAAKREGVPVVAYDRIIYDAPIDLYITQNSFKVGVLQAESAVKATNGKGNFIILSGAQGHSVAEAITAGAKSVLNNYPDIKIVSHQYHAGWSAQLALNTVENALAKNKNEVAAILANNSGMAHGAVQAVAEQGLSGKVFIAGADADLASIKDIVAGKQSFEVLKDIRPLAEAAAKAAVQLAKGEAVQGDSEVNNGAGNIPVVNTPVYGITNENIEKMIIESNFHPRAAIYSN